MTDKGLDATRPFRTCLVPALRNFVATMVRSVWTLRPANHEIS